MEARRAETSEPVVRKSIARLAKHLARETAAIEAAIGEHLAANAALHADCERLCAIPASASRPRAGSSPSCRATSPTPARPPPGAASPRVSARAAVACAVPVPSGARATASCANSSICPRSSPAAPTPRPKAFADSLEARSKSKMSALLAVEHKLLRYAFILLKHRSYYDPNHHPLKPS
ncbi:MAG: hypothetical protein ABIP85_18595 [Chthoniobacteraceae bacterium]